MNTMLLPDGRVMCTECTRVYRTEVTAGACAHVPSLVDRPAAWNEDPPSWAIAIAIGAAWIMALTVFVILPAYIAWH